MTLAILVATFGFAPIYGSRSISLAFENGAPNKFFEHKGYCQGECYDD